MTSIDRRTALKAFGSSLVASGLAGSVNAHGEEGGDGTAANEGRLRLFSDVAVDGALEAVTQGNYVYVATGSGLAVVDWRNPARPEVVARLDASDPDEGEVGGILDVKVDGDLASLASNEGSGVTLVDVSDPTTPEELGFYDAGHGIHNNFLDGEYAYLTVNESSDYPFSEARTEVVDVSDPTAPVKVGEYRLRDHFSGYATSGTSPCHDVYVQDDRLYQAFWDAGTVVADVSDPSDPQTVSQFGAAPKGDEEFSGSFPLERYLTSPGNAHYVQPSPEGRYVYVGAETFPGEYVEDPDHHDYGGIKVFDVSDPDDPFELTRIAPPNLDVFRTSHNFDVTENRLHTSWYDGGVAVFDVTDPATPERVGHYAAEGSSFWTAVQARGFTVGSDIGGGLVFLHADRGSRRPPAFEGDARPTGPEVDLSP
ncbi:LVIVD repeat-containing protein [Halogranum amylolyticum]|uniref:LVIVD repeat-containing protein n=1 Tax=Halogranum amylolyticum TaxID=660520 RepID=A0A1H8SQG9_9EURY|nr:hypothetical protein [Halogranum amylolyticum]SEO80588.1 LVIVD repeat-containing protein [Halogranum amylolyticum]